MVKRINLSSRFESFFSVFSEPKQKNQFLTYYKLGGHLGGHLGGQKNIFFILQKYHINT